jgi:aspartyl-tRNA(Asn)/glutamyl-tRNA(Gln) amidotransferase subunit B
MDYSVVIGLEVHVQLLTKTKAFCGCSTKFNPTEPNVQTCPVCLGLPGSLPVLNREAYRLALKTALALNCEIAPFTKWDRKQYYYPDLPKGYQISQYDLPFSQNGWMEFTPAGSSDRQRVRIIRAHLEEDAGKNLHDESGRGADSHVDLNRAGTPLVEIVSHPDLTSPADAKAFLQELALLLSYLKVSDCNMQEGSLRCDANVNLHMHTPKGIVPTPITEIKNVNSFRNVELALEYEVKRLADEFARTGKRLGEVAKETRGFDAARGVTFAQRGKEEASDYRYFPDPDLVPVVVSTAELNALRAELGETPTGRRTRFATQYGLSEYDINVLVNGGPELTAYFEATAQACGDGKQACNWITQDLLREMNERGIASIADVPVREPVLADLIKRTLTRQVSIKSAREVLLELLNAAETTPPSSARIDAIIASKGLAMVSDTGAIEAAIAAVIEKNPKPVADFKAGKQAAVGALIGQVMKAVKGADPAAVRELLVQKLSG